MRAERLSRRVGRASAITFVTAVAVMMAGCSGSGVGVDIQLDLASDGSVEERVSVRGAKVDASAPGWTQDSSATAEYSRTFDDPSALPEAEAELLTVILDSVSDEIGFAPVVLDRSKLDIVVQDYLFFKSVEVAYRLPEIDFRPPHCLECEGDGRHDCEECDRSGSLTCPACAGEGVRECDECEAQGSHTCQSCEGAGYRECDSCDSRGWRECFSCSGSGTDSWGDSCWSCGGSGRRDCYSCSGDGRLGCWSCDDTGEIECRRCDGEGEVECSECSGFASISCHACDGQGSNACLPCGGVGSPTSADMASYESALADANIILAIRMPGLVDTDAETSWHFGGTETRLPDEVRTSSRVPNWPLALGSGGGLLGLLLLGVTLSVRRIRRRVRSKVPALVVEPLLPPAEEFAVALEGDGVNAPASQVSGTEAPRDACRECGNAMGEAAAFCTECGTRR